MVAFITIMFPSIVGIKAYSIFNDEKLDKDSIINYLIYVLLSNAFMFLVFYLFNDYDENIMSYINAHSFFAFKYIVLSIFVNIVLSIVMSVFKKGFSFKIESVKKDVKKSNKKRKKSN